MYRALIVDDEDIIKIGLKTIIDWEQLGFEIVGTAEDGLEAIKKVEELSPDLIITDIIMPRMDGIELMEELKKRGFAGKIIVLSNYGEVDYVKRAMKLGAEDYILKVSYSKEEFAVLLKKGQKTVTISGRRRVYIRNRCLFLAICFSSYSRSIYRNLRTRSTKSLSERSESFLNRFWRAERNWKLTLLKKLT